MSQYSQYIDKLANKLNIPDKEMLKQSIESTSVLLSTRLIFDFLNDLKQHNLICLDDIYTSMDEVIIFNHINYELSISEKKYNSLMKCPNNKLIAIPIGIYSPLLPNNIGHLNIIIIDPMNKVIEYFEPFGKDNTLFIPELDVPELIMQQISDIFGVNYRFENASQLCPTGLQQIDDPSSYRCGAWCMFILYLKIYNNSRTIGEIESIIIKNASRDGKEITNLIKKFMTMIESKYSNGVITPIMRNYKLLDYIQDDKKKRVILEFIDRNITNYFKDLIEEKAMDIDNDNIEYNYNFYNIISLNKLNGFHNTIEKILRKAISDTCKDSLNTGYKEGYDTGYKEGHDTCYKEGVNKMELDDENEMRDADNNINDSSMDLSSSMEFD